MASSRAQPKGLVISQVRPHTKRIQRQPGRRCSIRLPIRLLAPLDVATLRPSSHMLVPPLVPLLND